MDSRSPTGGAGLLRWSQRRPSRCSLLGLVVVSGGDADAPAPADTVPTPATTTHEGSDTTGEAAGVVSQFFDAYSTGDTETIAALLADDVTIMEWYDGPKDDWVDPNRTAAPVPSPTEYLVAHVEQGETPTKPTCDQVDAQTASCAYSMQIVAGETPVWVPVRAEMRVADGRIVELQQGFGHQDVDFFPHIEEIDNEYYFALDDLIFRTYPEYWDAVFGDVATAQAAAVQARQQAAWLEIAMTECNVASNCDSPRVPAPDIPDERIQAFRSEIRRDGARWSDRTTGDGPLWWPGICATTGFQFGIDFQPDMWHLGSTFAPVEPGLPSLYVETPPHMSVEQSEVIVDWITSEAACNASIQPLPSGSTARGYIVEDEYAAFAVTHPSGGIVWMRMGGQGVTPELVNELATEAQQYLDDALGDSPAND